MKRIYCLLFVLIFMLVQPVTVFANVGMIYSADREGTEFFVDDTHPLIVESEQLTFDVHTRKVSHAKALWSDVTAAYTVANPTVEAVEVQAVFPVILLDEEYWEEPNTHHVRLDGQDIPFEILYSNVELASFEDMEFSELLSRFGQNGHADRNIVLLSFPLRAEPHQTCRLEISSVTSAVSDHKLVSPFYIITRSEYTFRYFLSPARHWADFKDLTVTIHAPAAAPFLGESSLDFQPSGINTYTAHCDTLPDENLSFTLVRSVPCSCLVLGCICFMLVVIRYVIRKRNHS